MEKIEVIGHKIYNSIVDCKFILCLDCFDKYNAEEIIPFKKAQSIGHASFFDKIDISDIYINQKNLICNECNEVLK